LITYLSCSGAHLYHQYLSGIKLCPYPCRFFPILQYSYDAEFIQNFSKTNKIQKLKHLIAFFQILILLNGFHKYAPKELEIKETTETAPSTSFLDIFLKSDTNWSTRLYDKREDFYFAIRKLILKCQPLSCMKLTFHNS
jgi:hypothetical protein